MILNTIIKLKYVDIKNHFYRKNVLKNIEYRCMKNISIIFILCSLYNIYKIVFNIHFLNFYFLKHILIYFSKYVLTLSFVHILYGCKRILQIF